MKRNDKNEAYAEDYAEFVALCGKPEFKEGAKNIVEQNIDLASRYGVSDKEYEALTKPIRIYEKR